MIITKPIAGQDYRAGFIGFCKTRNQGGLVQKLSDAITWFENREEECEFEKALAESTPDAPSHVFIVKDKLTVIHAYAGGVQESPISMFLANPNVQVVFREPIDMGPKDADLIIQGARSILGRPYNYLGLIGRALAVVLPLHHFAWYLKLPLIDNMFFTSYYCSAAASHALKNDPKYATCSLFCRMHESKVMPSTLYAEGPFKPLRFDKSKEEFTK